jgi:hypothetical protein
MPSGTIASATMAPRIMPPRPEGLTTVATRPRKDPPTPPPASEPIAAPAAERGRPGRAHVQQNLHHLDRVIRHAVKDALGQAGDVDNEAAKAYQDLTRDFRASLQDAFHAAGDGGAFDHAALLTSVGDALSALTEGLRSLRGAEDEATPPGVEAPAEPGVDLESAPVPGGLVSELA